MSDREIPAGWHLTKDGDYQKESSMAIAVVRDGLKPYVRVWSGQGGNPTDFAFATLKECFERGDEELR